VTLALAPCTGLGLTLCLVPCLARAQAPDSSVAHLDSVALEPGRAVDAVALADLDGDGSVELLLALHGPERFARHLETWGHGAGGALERRASLALTRDVVAFAHGDVLPGGGEELVLLNAGGAFALRPGPEPRPVRLASVELLWQAPDPEGVFEWSEGVRDLDADGRMDLVLPEAGGFALVLQRPPAADGAVEAADSDSWGALAHVRIPPADLRPRARRGRGAVATESGGGSFSLSIRAATDETPEVGPLVRVRARLPAPHWLDWDADSDLDLLVQGPESLRVWLQGAGGVFESAPALSLELPVPEDEDRRLDSSYEAQAVDLDRDQRADYVVFASDKRSDDVRTQGLCYLQADARRTEGARPFLDPEGSPSGVLVFAGFLMDPGFRDLDGDGDPELVLSTLRPDLIDQIRSAASQSLDVELFAYHNERGTLARRPSLAHTFSLRLDDSELQLEFLGDLSGDGLSELLVREAPESVRVLMLRAERGKEASWSLADRPLWELGIAREASIEVLRSGAERRASLAVIEPSQVLWVRFE